MERKDRGEVREEAVLLHAVVEDLRFGAAVAGYKALAADGGVADADCGGRAEGERGACDEAGADNDHRAVGELGVGGGRISAMAVDLEKKGVSKRKAKGEKGRIVQTEPYCTVQTEYLAYNT